jgi:multiple antibiotic resistance protein
MGHLIQATVALLAITNPLGAASVYVGLSEQLVDKERFRAAFTVCAVVFLILASAAVGGIWVLRAFGISIPAFQAAGGLVVILMGLEMLRGRHTLVQHDHAEGEGAQDQIVVPLAMPLIAGPGAITTTLTLTVRGGGDHALPVVILAILVTTFVLFSALLASAWIDQRMSPRAHRLLLRFMGLILVSVGAQLLLSGVRGFWQA